MLPVALGVAVAGFVVWEGSGRLATVDPPDIPAGLSSLQQPVFHIPSDWSNDSTYMWWSTDGFPDIANGISGFVTDELTELQQETYSFPDAESLQALRSYGVRTVVAHKDLLPGTSYQDVPNRSAVGLGVRVRETGDLLIYELDVP